MILYYVRHGDPIYDPDSLTPLGQEQAKAVAKRMALYGLDEVYASTSTRAILTAQPTCDLLKKQATLLDWAHEGHAWEELAVTKADGVRTWVFDNPEIKIKFRTKEVRNLGNKWYTYAGLEPFEKGIRRIETSADAFLDSLGYQHERENSRYVVKGETSENHKRVALFAHQGFGLAFLSSIMDIPYPTFSTSFDLSHSSVTAILFEKDKDTPYVYPKILQLANDSHLYKEGILTGYNNGLHI